MKAKLAALPAVVAVLLLAAAACGGDGGPKIEVSRGLAAVGGAPPSGKAEVAIPAPAAVLPASPFGAGAAGRGGDGGPAFGPAPGLLQPGATGLTVQGFGRASAPADGATLQLFVGSGFAYYSPKEAIACPPGQPCPPPEVPIISEADLEPILAAIRGQGVAEGDIKVTWQPIYGPYEPRSATITVTMRNLGKLDAIVEAATGAADQSDKVAIQSTNVLYTVDDCAPLEREAMRGGVEDARDRVQLLAEVLDVGVGDVIAASHYSYSPFGPNPCDPSFVGFEFGYGGGMPYTPGQPPQVQIIASLSVTFAVR